MILFGSYARGNPNKHSDIDLMVIENTNLPIRQRGLNYGIALADLNTAKDVVVRTPAEYALRAESKNTLEYFVRKEGKILYERR